MKYSRFLNGSTRLLRRTKALPLLAVFAASCAVAQPLSDGERVFIGGNVFGAQAPEDSRAIQTFGDDLIRFAVAPGEQWARDNRKGSNAERAELSSHDKVRFGEETSVSFAVRIEEMDSSPGRKHALLFQLHGPNRTEMPGVEGFAPPPFDMRVRRGQIHFVVRSGALDRGEDGDRVIATVPLEYGSWSSYRFDVGLGDETSGYVDIWKDGVQLAAYEGPVGYDVGGGRHYWKFGIYQFGRRNTPSVVDFGQVNLNSRGYLLQHEKDIVSSK